MKDFFGFIDYNKGNFSTKRQNNSNKNLFSQESSDYHIFFRHHQNNFSNSYTDQQLFLFFNGKVSNKQQLLSWLSLKNNSELSNHAELIMLAYKQWGIELLLERLEGSFTLIIYDDKENSLILAKDKVGKSPLFFYHSENLIVFGSNISQFKEAPTFIPQISPNGLASYLQFGAVLQPLSILENCYKLKSGHFNQFNLSSKGQTYTKYWSLESCYQTKKILKKEEEIIDEAEILLKASLSQSETTQEPVSASLSGGYDSSTVVALLQQERTDKVATFTIGFNEDDINEAKDAKVIASHLGTEHHEHYFTPKDALEMIPKLSTVYDEPFAEYAATPTILTAELIAKEGISNIFVGDGGDEVFATADDVHFFENIRRTPRILRESLTYPMKKLPLEKIPYLKTLNNFPTKVDKLMNILSAPNIPKMIESRNILFREEELQRYIIDYKSPIETTFDTINFNGYQESVDEIIGTYFKTTMTDGELVKSYSAMNYQNIELYTPFLNEQLIAYMASIPASIKIKNGIKKYILKEIAYRYIPKKLLDRPKSGFNIPFGSWMRNELKDLVYSVVNEKRLNEEKLFYTSSVIRIRDNFYGGNDAFKYKLWRIFIFQLWYKNFKG